MLLYGIVLILVITEKLLKDIKMKNLIISPHIDDEVLGCYSVLTNETHVMECGVDDFHIVNKEERLIELSNLANYKNIKYSVYDNKVNSYVIQNLIPQIEQAINTIKPEFIFLPYPSYNQDHVTTYGASLVALRHHDINFFVKKVLVYEEVHSFLWDYTHNINNAFKANYFTAIDIEDKIKTYRILKSQVREHRSPETLTQIAKLRGTQSNTNYAEAFQIIRWIN